MKKVLLYDIEIEKAILGRNEEPIPGIEYCGGFEDHAGCGVSCIGVWDYVTDRARIFCRDNFPEFQTMLNTYDIVVGFNTCKFDNNVLRANGFTFNMHSHHYDLLREMWLHDGLNPDEFNFRTHGGYGLDRCVSVNFGLGKTGNGALAPVWYQQGKIGMLHDYCLNDVAVTKRLFDRIAQGYKIIHPKTGAQILLPLPTTEQWLKVG